MKDKSQWKWYGHAGHLSVAQWCRFHLCTLVGEYLVSTVGEYLPDAGVREIFARTRGVTLVGEGDFRIADYMEKIGFESLGCGTEKYNGIEVNQVVRVKSSGQLGRVVAVDDHHDRFPADLQLEMSDQSLLKIRVDEVQTLEQLLNDNPVYVIS